jgi:serine/threonine protein kinase
MCHLNNELSLFGLPYVFGVNAVSRLYFIVIECSGINGKTVTLAEAAKTKLFSTEKEWVGALKMCAESIHHLHEQDFIHCDLKGDNIVIEMK